MRRRIVSRSIAFCIVSSRLLGAGLAGLLAHDLVRVADPLALVDVGGPERADLGGDLADLLAVDPADGQLRLLIDRDLDPVRDREVDRVRVPEGEAHGLSRGLSAVADPLDLEVLTEALRHAGDRVRQERAREAVEGPLGLRVVPPLDDALAV